MKVICIEQVKNLTINKTYEVEYSMGPGGDDEEYNKKNLLYWLTDDYGYKEYYKCCFFTTLGELREKRINEILE